MSRKYRAECYKTVCEMCLKRDKKKVLGGYTCKLGRKPSQNKCYYFTCEGKDMEKCSTCMDYRK